MLRYEVRTGKHDTVGIDILDDVNEAWAARQREPPSGPLAAFVDDALPRRLVLVPDDSGVLLIEPAPPALSAPSAKELAPRPEARPRGH